MINFLNVFQRRLYHNVRAVPLELQGVMDQVTFDKARLYQLDKSNFAKWSGLYAHVEMMVRKMSHKTTKLLFVIVYCGSDKVKWFHGSKIWGFSFPLKKLEKRLLSHCHCLSYLAVMRAWWNKKMSEWLELHANWDCLSVCSHTRNSKYFWFKYDLGQKYYSPQVWPDWGSNSWPPDHDRTFHVTEIPALTTRPSVI